MTYQEYRIACRAIASGVYAQFRLMDPDDLGGPTDVLAAAMVAEALEGGWCPHECMDDEHAKDVARHTTMDRKAFDRIPLSKRKGRESYHRMHHDCLALISFSFLKTIIGRDR